jgi:hypothetical protein
MFALSSLLLSSFLFEQKAQVRVRASLARFNQVISTQRIQTVVIELYKRDNIHLGVHVKR